MAKSLGRAIRDLREELGLGRGAVARAAHLDPTALFRIEKGERKAPSFATICAISVALGVSLDELAARAGLVRAKSLFRSRPTPKASVALPSVESLEKLLRRAAVHVETIKKRLHRE